MAGGHTCCFFGVVVLLGLSLYDVETSDCSKIIHAQVGDTVKLPSCLSPEGVTSARWKFKDTFVAAMDNVNLDQSRSRTDQNSNFSLILSKLTHEDSGVYSFISEVNDRQRETTIITLHVHDLITKPVLTAQTSLTANRSCLVSLECNSSSVSIKHYKWTVKNRTSGGSYKLQYIISPQDGETEFTCTITNLVTEQSASTTERCSNDTSSHQESDQIKLILFLSAGVGAVLLTAIVVITVICACVHKKRQAGSDSNDLTVYTDISEVIQDTTRSVYETIDVTDTAHTSGPKTVYDNIQFKYMKRTSEAADPQT